MNSEDYRDTCIGFNIVGWKRSQNGDYLEWQFEVTDAEANSVFRLSFLVSNSALAMNRISPDSASPFVRDEGIKRVKGRLLLNRYNKGAGYRHKILTTGEEIEPIETVISPPFNSDEEKVRYYLLKALKRIRVELLPDTFQYMQIDVSGLCSVLGVPARAGKAALNILEEKGLIGGIETPSDKTYGGFDYPSLYITSSGLDEFEKLEREITKRWGDAMPDVTENAMLILGILYEKGTISVATSMTAGEVERLTNLSTEDFNVAEDFLISTEYIEYTLGGSTRSQWLTTEGINWYKSEKEKRIPLSIDALRIARYIYGKTSDASKSFVASKDILDALQFEDAAYRKACQELADRGLLVDKRVSDQISYRAVALTSTGRNAYRDGFKIASPAYSFQQSVGAIFQGPVSDSNIQAIAVAVNSNIQQAVSGGSVQDLRGEISNLIEQLVDQVKHELNLDQLLAYTKKAKELKNEVMNPNPDPTVIQSILATLEFLGNVDGTIELGKKGLELAVKYAPLVLTLKQAIFQLFQLISP